MYQIDFYLAGLVGFKMCVHLIQVLAWKIWVTWENYFIITVKPGYKKINVMINVFLLLIFSKGRRRKIDATGQNFGGILNNLWRVDFILGFRVAGIWGFLRGGFLVLVWLFCLVWVVCGWFS